MLAAFLVALVAVTTATPSRSEMYVFLVLFLFFLVLCPCIYNNVLYAHYLCCHLSALHLLVSWRMTKIT